MKKRIEGQKKKLESHIIAIPVFVRTIITEQQGLEVFYDYTYHNDNYLNYKAVLKNN